MALTLSQFLRQQLTAQQLTEREFSDRSRLGLSHVYQILRGERKHTRGDTIDKIAAGLGMTPAEMAVAMGRAGDIDPDETELLAIYRQVAREQRPAVKSMLRGLAGMRRPRVTKSGKKLGNHNVDGKQPKMPRGLLRDIPKWRREGALNSPQALLAAALGPLPFP